MTLILKVNAIQDWTLKGALKSSGLGGGVLKKAYVGVREMKLGKRVQKRLKNTKIKHQFNQISLT